jgi:hypothetical protein
MSVHHRRQQDSTMLDGSLRVRGRSLDLLAQLDPFLVKQKLESLLDGLKGEGEEEKFFRRWNYDDEQKQEIMKALVSVYT